jgi:3-oxoadipate CoA-transferase, beta subunit
MMNLFTKDGTAKLVPACTYPLTGLRCVRRVYTEHAIFDIDAAAGTVRVRETFGIAITELASRMAIDLH